MIFLSLPAQRALPAAALPAAAPPVAAPALPRCLPRNFRVNPEGMVYFVENPMNMDDLEAQSRKPPFLEVSEVIREALYKFILHLMLGILTEKNTCSELGAWGTAIDGTPHIMMKSCTLR